MSSKPVFTEIMVASKSALWSPNGLFVANVSPNQDKVFIRTLKLERKKDVKIFRTYNVQTLNRVDVMEWSPDSSYLAIASLHQGLAQIFSLDDLSWKCKIDLGSESEGTGLVQLSWSPKARHVLTISAHHVQLTIWSLTGRDVQYIRDILPITDCKSFSFDGSKMAIAQFDEQGNKLISVYDTEEWKSVRTFQCQVKDFHGLKWSPDNTVILVWDSPLFSNIYLYSNEGQLLKHYSPDGLSRGIQSIAWSPTGQFLAFTNHQNKVRVMNGLTYGIVLEEVLEKALPSDYPECLVYSEITNGKCGCQQTYNYEIQDKLSDAHSSCSLSTLQTTRIKFSWDGKFIAVCSSTFPTTLWIWNLSTTKLATVLSHRLPIEDFNWSPTEDFLSLVTGNHSIYFWSSKGGFVVRIPDMPDFRVNQVKWNPHGDSVLLADSGRFTICYITQ